MLQKIEHIGIAVKSLEIAVPLYEQLLHTPCYKTESVDSEGVDTAFFKTGDTKIELLAATHPDSPIRRFIEKRGEGLHHIAYLVEDITAEMQRLKEDGFQLLQEKPRKGADNKWVCFIHPKSVYGVLTELCQELEE